MTTPTAEQGAAAERWRLLKSAKATQDEYAVYRDVKSGRIGGIDFEELQRLKKLDAELLADFALAVMQGDGGEAVDEAWLMSIGFSKDDNPTVSKMTITRDDNMPIGLWRVSDGWKAMLIHHLHAASQIVRGLTTRAQVRALLAALGIK